MATDFVPSPLKRIYPAGVVLGAIATHLASEFFSMGADADAQIVLSPRHVYLAIAALACLVLICHDVQSLIRRADNRLDLKRLVANEVARLPLGGGWRFLALTACLQLAAGIGTAVGEGCLFCGHDIVAGLLGAVLIAIALAVAGRLLALRLPNFAAEVAAILMPAQDGGARPAHAAALVLANPLRLFFVSPQLSNRPPPLFA